MAERRYSDEEVAEILKVAVETGGALVHRGSEGLSLAEVQAIAAEVGIDTGRVESAALALDVAESQRSVPVLGTPYAPQFEVRVPGAVSPEDFPEVLATIRRVMGRHGIPDERFGALEWKAQDTMGGRYVSVHPKDDEIEIRAYGNFRDGIMTSFLPTFLGMGMVAGLGGLALEALGISVPMGAGLGVPFTLVAGFFSGLGIWRWRYRKEDAQLRRVAELLAVKLRLPVGNRSDERTLPSGDDPLP
jgi:hypothetical protein